MSSILPQHVHSLNIEIEAPMKSIIERLEAIEAASYARFAQGA